MCFCGSATKVSDMWPKEWLSNNQAALQWHWGPIGRRDKVNSAVLIAIRMDCTQSPILTSRTACVPWTPIVCNHSTAVHTRHAQQKQTRIYCRLAAFSLSLVVSHGCLSSFVASAILKGTSQICASHIYICIYIYSSAGRWSPACRGHFAFVFFAYDSDTFSDDMSN